MCGIQIPEAQVVRNSTAAAAGYTAVACLLPVGANSELDGFDSLLKIQIAAGSTAAVLAVAFDSKAGFVAIALGVLSGLR